MKSPKLALQRRFIAKLSLRVGLFFGRKFHLIIAWPLPNPNSFLSAPAQNPNFLIWALN